MQYLRFSTTIVMGIRLALQKNNKINVKAYSKSAETQPRGLTSTEEEF